jgi:integral membrane protein (TIGR00529 family)
VRQTLAVIIGFSFIPILSRKKVPISYSILIGALVMMLVPGLDLDVIGQIFKSTILEPKKIEQYLIVLEIGILGTLLKNYGFIEIIIDKLNKVVANKKLQLMFLPALIGLLMVPGGAIISAPFIDKIGDELDIEKPRRAVINMVYRHISMHFIPYSNSLLLMALLLPQVSVYNVIGLNIIYAIIYATLGYFSFIKDIKNEKPQNREDSAIKNFLQLALYTLPIYFAVILNVAFKTPFHIGILANILILFLLKPQKTIIKDFIKGINITLFLTIFGVYLIQATISSLPEFNSMLESLLSNPATLIPAMIGVSAFFGLATGFQPAAMGVILPVIGGISLSVGRMTALAHIAFTWSFIGYFFSPIHLCQLFTAEYMRVDNASLYKEYSRFIVILIIATIAESFIMLTIFK